ncbi:MAG: hypothetical protein CM1200mP40_35830 [Gammaproteobacteria bacterium]|nr:MAG: hypothetical protein CM1200mP40_35830 [Gammaproteobacteria bacterium]
MFFGFESMDAKNLPVYECQGWPSICLVMAPGPVSFHGKYSLAGNAGRPHRRF